MGVSVQWLINLTGKTYGLCPVSIVSMLDASPNLKVSAKYVSTNLMLFVSPPPFSLTLYCQIRSSR